MKKEKRLTPKRKRDLLSVIDGRIYLVKSELERLSKLLLADLEAVKKWIETL